ncbi:MAG TPA: hypothetical protein VGJ26_16440 [Pirellulales bacterium]|jgi:hypothetical protein
MSRTNWNAEATRVANFLVAQGFDAPRGALLWRDRLLVAFGHDGYSHNGASGVVSEAVKAFVAEEEDAEELGFGVGDIPDGKPGYTWVLVICLNAPLAEHEEIRSDLEDEMWAAWRAAMGGELSFQRRPETQAAMTAALEELAPPQGN